MVKKYKKHKKQGPVKVPDGDRITATCSSGSTKSKIPAREAPKTRDENETFTLEELDQLEELENVNSETRVFTDFEIPDAVVGYEDIRVSNQEAVPGPSCSLHQEEFVPQTPSPPRLDEVFSNSPSSPEVQIRNGHIITMIKDGVTYNITIGELLEYCRVEIPSTLQYFTEYYKKSEEYLKRHEYYLKKVTFFRRAAVTYGNLGLNFRANNYEILANQNYMMLRLCFDMMAYYSQVHRDLIRLLGFVKQTLRYHHTYNVF